MKLFKIRFLFCHKDWNFLRQSLIFCNPITLDISPNCFCAKTLKLSNCPMQTFVWTWTSSKWPQYNELKNTDNGIFVYFALLEHVNENISNHNSSFIFKICRLISSLIIHIGDYNHHDDVTFVINFQNSTSVNPRVKSPTDSAQRFTLILIRIMMMMMIILNMK